MTEKNDVLDDNHLPDGEAGIYEAGFHILPTVPEERLQEVVSKLVDFITKNGGVIISEEFPKIRNLSYEIKKRVETKYFSFGKAYFGWVKFEILPASIGKIEMEMKNNENILRFIILKTIRENTMHVFKSPMVSRENNKEEIVRVSKDIDVKEKVEISEEEIDKSIDELVIDQVL